MFKYCLCYNCIGTGTCPYLSGGKCKKCEGRGERPWGLKEVTYGWGSFSVTQWEYGYVTG